jgi:hypothetical protein
MTMHNLTAKIHKIRVCIIFILTANGFLPGGSGNTMRHNKQLTHITQNNTTIKSKHKTTHTIKDTLHRMNTNNHNYNYKLINTTIIYQNYQVYINTIKTQTNTKETNSRRSKYYETNDGI